MANPWFRLYGGEFLSDSKIMSLDGNERSIWITLLCLASQTEGVVSFMTEPQVIEKAGVKNKVRYVGVLEKFQERGMITLCNGNVTILNWAKRQYSEGYLRVKAHRETKLKRKSNENVTPYTDTDTDTDTESDTDNTNTAFNSFWDAFPKKIAKKQAEKAFKKINPAELPAILQDISRRKKTEDWQKKDGQFIPYPATYLNNERWKDELITPKAEPPPRNCKICGRPTKDWIQSGSGVVCHDCNSSPPRAEGKKRLQEIKAGGIKTIN